MVRLAEWPRNPYLNEELHEWVQLHLDALGVDDVAVYATAGGREDDERRILVVTEVGLLDGWYAPRGSTARYSLSIRLHPWQAVHGVDLRGETFRLWAHEHQSRWRLRMARPALDTVADSPELGRALTQFAAACSVMAEPAGASDGLGDDRARDARRAVGGPAPSRPPVAGDQEEAAFAEPVPAPDEEAATGAAAAPAPPAPAPAGGTPPPPPQGYLPGETVVLEPPRPPIRTEPELDREPGPEEARSLDLARRLGLR